TFFNWPNNYKGRIGSGQVQRIAFRVPNGSLEHWETHLQSHGIETVRTQLFDKATVEFSDIHELPLALVEADEGHSYDNGGNILGFHGVSTLSTEPHQRSEEHTSELQSRFDLVCRLLLEKKKNKEQ